MSRKGKMIVETIESKFLQKNMELKIYQPETFSPLYKYHLCIMQDGNDYYQLGRIATLSDQLHDELEIENTVFVGIHYEDRYDRLKKYHPDGEENVAYTNFLTKEVVPFLDELLPTYNMGGARTLMGDSLAGTLALMTALKYPNTFGKVIMQSPLVNETVLKTVEEATKVDTIEIYHTIGTNETSVKTSLEPDVDFLAPNRALNELLKTKSMNYTYKEIQGGEHTWKYWQQDMKDALTTMFSDD